MKFFFADSQDLVDPSFDFEKESRADGRVRHRDDHYAHELFKTPPYDGVLVSKAIVDGIAGAAGKYTTAQRHRLLRCGIREFLRLDERPGSAKLETMGDCGAFSYVREPEPPFTVDEVLEFYAGCNFDYGVSVDHVILDYVPEADRDRSLIPDGAQDRQDITLSLAGEFRKRHASGRFKFTAMGVAQGWSPKSYASSVVGLQKLGYRHIALGGMVPLKNDQILASLAAIDEVRKPDTQLHLFGVSRCDQVEAFARMGVTSFDSTSPLRQAFKDDKDNYHTFERTFMAIRVPQVEGNPKLQRLIRAGKVDHDKARKLEKECMASLVAFDKGKLALRTVVDRLGEYEKLHDGRTDRRKIYAEVLEAAPWKHCACDVCRALGVHVIIFRGADRNRRRGFHNLYVLWRRLQALATKPAKTRQTSARKPAEERAV